MAIGLKGSWKETRGCSLKYRLKETYWNLRYAWLRAWYGFDYRDTFNMNGMFVEKYKAILRRYKEYNFGLFNVPEEYRDQFGKLFFDEEETDVIIDMMIYHLEMIDEDHVEKVLYGKNANDADWDANKDWSMEKATRIANVVHQNKKLFMKLFDIFFFDLWY